MSKKLIGREHSRDGAVMKLIKKGVIFRKDSLWKGSLTMNIDTDKIDMGIKSWGLVDYLCGQHKYGYLVEYSRR